MAISDAEAYAQVTHLFETAPELVEEFKRFIPFSAAQVATRAPAKQATVPAQVPSNPDSAMNIPSIDDLQSPSLSPADSGLVSVLLALSPGPGAELFRTHPILNVRTNIEEEKNIEENYKLLTFAS